MTTDDLCNDLTTAAKWLVDEAAALNVLLARAECALDILAEWYVKDVGYPLGPVADVVAAAAYSKAVQKLENDAR